MSGELVLYREACRALVAARTTDEVKDIRDRGLAIKLYAEQAKNKLLAADAWEVIKRAERRLGEMMADQPKAMGTRGQLIIRDSSGGFSTNPPDSDIATYAGIDKNPLNEARLAGANVMVIR
jgi:hypothetical protein